MPIDQVPTEVLQSFDKDGVYAVWEKALARRDDDPEGAITLARTLLETVCKRILEECGEVPTENDDLPRPTVFGRKVLARGIWQSALDVYSDERTAPRVRVWVSPMTYLLSWSVRY